MLAALAGPRILMRETSALGQKQTFGGDVQMSALHLTADVNRREADIERGMSEAGLRADVDGATVQVWTWLTADVNRQ